MIVIEPSEPGPNDALFASLNRPELRRYLKRAQSAIGLQGEVNLLLSDDARIRALNRAYRKKNKTTDVLSFPAAENGEGMAGDLAISVPVAQAQAEEQGHTLDTEIRVLTLHGLLHLAGHDHETDSGEMRSLEAQLRTRLKLPAGLIERVGTGIRRRSGKAAMPPTGKA